MKTNHTPGPWSVPRKAWNDPKDPHFDHCDVIHSGTRVAKVSGVGSEETEANARLVAAAPEMLEALEELLLHEGERDTNNGLGLELDSDDLELAKTKARAIISKAKGVV